MSFKFLSQQITFFIIQTVQGMKKVIQARSTGKPRLDLSGISQEVINNFPKYCKGKGHGHCHCDGQHTKKLQTRNCVYRKHLLTSKVFTYWLQKSRMRLQARFEMFRKYGVTCITRIILQNLDYKLCVCQQAFTAVTKRIII